MRVARAVIAQFLRRESVLITLTSSRMSSVNRRIHLIGREALLQRFLQMSKVLRGSH